MKIYAATQAGTTHLTNEDRITINGCVLVDGKLELTCLDDNLTVSISDGVGGESGGADASSFVSSKIAECEISEQELYKINKQLITYGKKLGSPTMATTIAALKISETKKCTVFWSGNSRVYVSSMGFLRRVTRDDTVSAETNCGTQKMDKNTPITACMGGSNEDLFKLKCETNDIITNSLYLLTSDGVHDYIPADMIEDIVLNGKPEKACMSLIQAALSNGSRDDMSVLLIVL